MDEPVPAEITRAIADVEGTDPAELDMSLQDWIDTDAIRQLVDHECDTWRLQFEVPTHTVTVTGEDTVLIDGRERRRFF